MAEQLQGWQPDPYGRHQERYFSGGAPTALARDGSVEVQDSAPISEVGSTGDGAERGPARSATTFEPASEPIPVRAEGPLEAAHSAPQPMPAGWYPDPGSAGQQRYWDGSTWTPSVQEALPSMAPVPASRRISRGPIFALLGIVIVAVVVGAILLSKHKGTTSASAQAPQATQPLASSHNILGTLEVDYPTATAVDGPGAPCNVPPDWGNESIGDQVVIRDGTGTTLATGSLNASSVDDGPGGPGCKFTFLVPSVPNSSFYTISVDGHSGPQYSESQLLASGWTMSLNLTP